MATPCMPMPQLDLGDTFGAFSVGVVVSSCLYGVSCLQTWYYFRNYRDHLLIRGIVLAILALETTHAILATHAMYHYLILNFGNLPALLAYNWSAIVIIPLTSAIKAIVHPFYAARVYQLSHRKDWWTPSFVFILTIVQVVLTIIITVEAAQVLSFTVLADNERIITMTTVLLLVCAAEDVICAVALSYYLHTNRSGIKSTDTLINKLIVHAINNGALTSVVAISVAAFMIPKPKNLVYLAILQVIANLYANSLLSTLNTRTSHVQASLPLTIDSSGLSSGTVGRSGKSALTTETQTAETPTSDMKVFVEKELDVHYGQQDMVIDTVPFHKTSSPLSSPV